MFSRATEHTVMLLVRPVACSCQHMQGLPSVDHLGRVMKQVKDLRAIRDLLDHHMDDLDDVFAMLREHGVDGAIKLLVFTL